MSIDYSHLNIVSVKSTLKKTMIIMVTVVTRFLLAFLYFRQCQHFISWKMNCEKKQIEDSNFMRSLSHSFYYQETVSLISIQLHFINPSLQVRLKKSKPSLLFGFWFRVRELPKSFFQFLKRFISTALFQHYLIYAATNGGSVPPSTI